MSSHNGHDEISYFTIDITPSLARGWLDRCNTSNRRLKPAIINRYAHDMATDAWYPTSQGISFTGNETDGLGTLVDGQHRLEAIVQSGKTVRSMVAFNVPMASQVAYDGHARRSPADCIKSASGKDVNHETAAIVRRMFETGTGRTGYIQPREMVVWYERTSDAIAFVTEVFVRKTVARITTAAAATPLVRAYFYGLNDEITEFAAALVTGEMRNTRDVTAISLRKWLQSLKSVSGFSVKNEVHQKTEWAFDQFVAGNECRRIMRASTELFPMEWEDASDYWAAKRRIASNRCE